MKRVIGIIIVIVVGLLIATGCTSGSVATTKNTDRFVEIYDDMDRLLFYDKETKVIYMYFRFIKSGGLTVLVDADGKPLLYEEK